MSSTYGLTSDPANDWRHKAPCRDEDPELFFPVGIETEGDLPTMEAKAFCRAFCDVRDECLRWALANGVDDGVWGATTPRERRRMRGLPVSRRKRRSVLKEQFPPIAELLQELPGVADRQRQPSRPRQVVAHA